MRTRAEPAPEVPISRRSGCVSTRLSLQAKAKAQAASRARVCAVAASGYPGIAPRLSLSTPALRPELELELAFAFGPLFLCVPLQLPNHASRRPRPRRLISPPPGPCPRSRPRTDLKFFSLPLQIRTALIEIY